MLGRPILGLGRIHHVLSGRARQRILGAAFDAGITAFDTAPCYGEGLAERELGRFLQGRRSQCDVLTKFGIPFAAIGELPSPLFFALRAVRAITRLPVGANYRLRDFSTPALRKSVAASLRRLQTSYVDCLFIHEPLAFPEPNQLADMIGGLESLVEEGLIRRYGVTLGPTHLRQGVAVAAVPAGLDVMAPVCEAVVEWCKQPALARRTLIYDLATYLTSRNRRVPTPEEVAAFCRTALPAASPIVASRQAARVSAYGRAFSDHLEPLPT
jgi:aryl-alcohol dehydrogenase-like predicted oxidoreductase